MKIEKKLSIVSRKLNAKMESYSVSKKKKKRMLIFLIISIGKYFYKKYNDQIGFYAVKVTQFSKCQNPN